MSTPLRDFLVTILAVLLLAGCARKSDSTQDTTTAEPTARPERHIPLERQPNFRDLGGYETADGRTVKWGQVYRSGQMPDLTDADVERRPVA
jgi:protein-tyrosine phosphatase